MRNTHLFILFSERVTHNSRFCFGYIGEAQWKKWFQYKRVNIFSPHLALSKQLNLRWNLNRNIRREFLILCPESNFRIDITKYWCWYQHHHYKMHWIRRSENCSLWIQETMLLRSFRQWDKIWAQFFVQFIRFCPKKYSKRPFHESLLLYDTL